MEFLVIVGSPLLLALCVAAQCSVARRAIRGQDAARDWLVAITALAPLCAVAALWLRHVAIAGINDAPQGQAHATMVAVAGLLLPAYTTIRLAWQAFSAMALVAAVGAAVFLDVRFLTVRLRTLEAGAWSMAALVFAGTVAMLVMLTRISGW